jgi:hypothetical protein
LAFLGVAGAARAEPAVVGVDGPVDDPHRVDDGDRDDRARPPPLERAVDSTSDDAGDLRPSSLVRVALGGAAAAMDRAGGHGAGGLGGLDLGLEIGRGPIGARFEAAWLRGESQGPGLAHYGAEVVVDAIPRGPFHPIAALGVALAHTGGADAGVGTLRLGVAYAIPVREADLRVAVSVLGALPGPADGDAADLRGYVMGVGSLAVGF